MFGFGNKKEEQAIPVQDLGNNDVPFFNVMPKAKAKGVMAQAQEIKKQEPEKVEKQDVSRASTPQVTSSSSTSGSVVSGHIPIGIPSRSVYSGIIEKKTETGGKDKKLINYIVKGVVGVLVVLGVAMAIWYTASSFGEDLGLPKLGSWIKSLPFVRDASPNTAGSASESGFEESREINPQADDATQNPLVTTADWRRRNFNDSECEEGEMCADASDPDKDALDNLTEFTNGTNPNNPDTDGDGISDGDELNIFECSPLDPRTAGDVNYTDADDILGGYNCARKEGQEEKYTESDLEAIAIRIEQFGFHEPTFETLGEDAWWYAKDHKVQASPSQLPEGVDGSEDAKLTRDVQRLDTVKKVGVALVKYRKEIGEYPEAANFQIMASKVKPFLTTATNPFDPVNVDPYLYVYIRDAGNGFSLGYFSETLNQAIKYSREQAEKDFALEEAQTRDEQRTYDLEKIRSALLIVSAADSEVSGTYLFPKLDELESKVVPQYLPKLPQDPNTKQPYSYEVGKDRTTFILKAVLENAPAGKTGYMCNQEFCSLY